MCAVLSAGSRRCSVVSVVVLVLLVAAACQSGEPQATRTPAPTVTAESTPLVGARELCRTLLSDDSRAGRPRLRYDDLVQLTPDHHTVTVSSRVDGAGGVRLAEQATDCLLTRLGAPADLRVSGSTGASADTTEHRASWLAYAVHWAHFSTQPRFLAEISVR